MESGFAAFFTTEGGWKNLVMIIIAFEPLLLCGIAFGCLLTNLSYFVGLGENALYHPELWEAFLDEASPYYHSYGHIMSNAGLLDFFYIGVKAGIYPSLIFLGVGAMTDFGPLLANPKSLLLGAAAQLGVFLAFFGAVLLGFTGPEAASIGIIASGSVRQSSAAVSCGIRISISVRAASIAPATKNGVSQAVRSGPCAG